MKKLITFRFDPDLLEKVRQTAQAENRTVTNFVETVLKRSVTAALGAQDGEPHASRRRHRSDQ